MNGKDGCQARWIQGICTTSFLARRPLTEVFTVLVLIAAGTMLSAQIRPTVIPGGVSRIEGSDPDNRVAYTRISIEGALIPPVEGASPPTLTAQCTKQPDGKLAFEIFANFGGVDDHAYHRPWMPKDGGLFAPRSQKVTVTMEFVGYVREKPVKRQWERLDRPAGELRYNTPGGGSANMEDVAYYMQYLKALPTLRLTYGGKTAEFQTAQLLKQLKLEPLCRAGGV